MSSALHQEHLRLIVIVESHAAGLGVLAGAPFTRVVADLRALGDEWEEELEMIRGLLDEANAELDVAREEEYRWTTFGSTQQC